MNVAGALTARVQHLTPIPQVLTRRQQLALAAKDKDKEEKRGRGRGGGRGRGRGKAKGMDGSKSSEPPPEHVPEKDGSDMDVDPNASSSKRAAMCTPERKKLFHDDEGSPMKDVGSPDKAPEPSPEVKPKKSKRPRGGKGPNTPQKEGETSEPDPKAKPKTKAAPRKTKKPDPAPEPSPPVEKANPDPKPKPKPASRKSQKPKAEVEKEAKPSKAKSDSSDSKWDNARKVLVDAKADPASLHHMVRLFTATTWDERPTPNKMQQWGFSLYHDNYRVGILQRKGPGKPKTHAMTISGGPSCKHIGIPLEASYMVVSFLFALGQHLGRYVGTHHYCQLTC